jgi:hypothetical protein
MTIIGNKIMDRVNKLLPKVLETAEKELGYSLPKVKIVNTRAYVQNNYYDDDYQIVLGSIYVEAIIDKKDGSFGKVKKLVNSVIENVVTVSGYEYREIYLTFHRAEPSEFVNENEKKPSSEERYLQLIKKTLEGKREFEGDYSMPYSSSDEDRVDVYIEYHISKASLWKSNGKHCQYEGVLEVTFDRLLVGFKHLDEWETAHIHDLPSWMEDNFKDSILDEIDMYENICMDIDYKTYS